MAKTELQRIVELADKVIVCDTPHEVKAYIPNIGGIIASGCLQHKGYFDTKLQGENVLFVLDD